MIQKNIYITSIVPLTKFTWVLPNRFRSSIQFFSLFYNRKKFSFILSCLDLFAHLISNLSFSLIAGSLSSMANIHKQFGGTDLGSMLSLDGIDCNTAYNNQNEDEINANRDKRYENNSFDSRSDSERDRERGGVADSTHSHMSASTQSIGFSLDSRLSGVTSAAALRVSEIERASLPIEKLLAIKIKSEAGGGGGGGGGGEEGGGSGESLEGSTTNNSLSNSNSNNNVLSVNSNNSTNTSTSASTNTSSNTNTSLNSNSNITANGMSSTNSQSLPVSHVHPLSSPMTSQSHGFEPNTIVPGSGVIHDNQLLGNNSVNGNNNENNSGITLGTGVKSESFVPSANNGSNFTKHGMSVMSHPAARAYVPIPPTHQLNSIPPTPLSQVRYASFILFYLTFVLHLCTRHYSSFTPYDSNQSIRTYIYI